MRLLVTTIIALAACAAHADIQYVDAQGDRIVVFEDACPAGLSQRIGERAEHYARATITAAGRTWSACAGLVGLPMAPGVPFVHVVAEGAGEHMFPLGLFEPIETAAPAGAGI